jgi:uncharacterized membrane protein
VARVLIRKLGADYVYVGDYERSLYVVVAEGKFSQLGRVVYEGQRARLFDVSGR